MMIFGITTAGIVPLRREKSERSVLASQALFGEMMEVTREEGRWCRVRMLHDGMEGWTRREDLVGVDEGFVRRAMEGRPFVTRDMFSIVMREGDWAGQLVPAGSVLPLYEGETGYFRVGDDAYRLVGSLPEAGTGNAREAIARYALMYYNVPYVAGGRSPWGIDNAGLVQMVYRLAGVGVPRQLARWAAEGQTLSFLEEALPGDVVLFGDESGVVTHAGVLWEAGRVIHASGRVRVDKIDHHGIFNEATKRYTHALKLIKRFL